MSNSLTGDFEVVLQVSGGTVNRLLASMHQNDFRNPNVPSFPHCVRLRIGDDKMIDGVRGRVDAQVAVPRIQLIHGATDRFILEVGIRARYVPDAATVPLPEFIHGTVRAEYQIKDINPKCYGWERDADRYIWVRVVKDSVHFDGTAEDDRKVLGGLAAAVHPEDPAAAHAANVAKITRQIAALLAGRFRAAPHPVSAHFKRGSMRSLSTPQGSVVAIPLLKPALLWGGAIKPADIASINTILTDGSDVALAADVAYIRSIVDSIMTPFKDFTRTVPVSASGISTVYEVSIDPPTVEAWEPHGSFAVITIKIVGSAKTKSVMADAYFDVHQNVTLNFSVDYAGWKGASGFLWIVAGSRTINVSAADGLFPGTVVDKVSAAVDAAVGPMVVAACAQGQPSLDAMLQQIQELVDQLRTLDDRSSVAINKCAFVTEGMVLRGTISLAPRHWTHVDFRTTKDRTEVSAFESWIPGGRIDKFEWQWKFFDPHLSRGNATHDDRFLLRRPIGKVGRWGGAIAGSMPVVGLDENGTLCLHIWGVLVDADTGELVTTFKDTSTEKVTTGKGFDHSADAGQCSDFTFNVRITQGAGQTVGPLLQNVPGLSQHVPFPELALVQPGVAQAEPANTLVLYVDEGWDQETRSALRGGLATCRRHDAGLILVFLFREGQFAAASQRVRADVEALKQELGIATVLNEDVRGGWSASLALRRGAGVQWRLVSPLGDVTWTHDGRATPEMLAAALDRHLVISPPPRPGLLRPALDIGTQLGTEALHPAPAYPYVESDCPSVPLGRLATRETVVTFIQPDSASSESRLRQLSSRYGQREDGPAIVVVVNGADARQAEALKNELGLDFVVLPDPNRTISNRFGIGIWPTTMTIDRTGVVSAVDTGVDTGEAGALPRGKAAE